MRDIESINEVGSCIKKHREAETKHYVKALGVARVLCDMTSDRFPDQNGRRVFWLTNKENLSGRDACDDGGKPIFRDSNLGGVLLQSLSCEHPFDQPMIHGKGINKMRVIILNRAEYTPMPAEEGWAKEITIKMAGERNKYQFQRLSDLIGRREELVDRREALKRKQEEDLQAIAALRRAAEEAAQRRAAEKEKELRQEEERRQDEERRNREELERLESQIEQSEKDISLAQSFIRDEVSLRLQHILDENQEKAKRSHLFDGVPVVIEGGPGTGKTTTMIQRLKFLISAQALKDDPNVKLNDAQISFVTDPSERDRNWLFFSPTEKLLGFLRNNMNEEELKANEYNTTTLPTFCKKVLLAYKLRNPDSDGPFKLYTQREGEDVLLKDARSAITSFESFLVHRITSILVKISQVRTSDYPWHKTAVEIKSYCEKAEGVKDITALMNLLNSMQANEKSQVKELEENLGKEMNRVALSVKRSVMSEEGIRSRVYDLFRRWEEESEVYSGDSAGEDEMDESEDDEDTIANLDFEPMLYRNIKPVLRKLSLKKYDPKSKLSKRQSEFHDIIRPCVNEEDLDELGSLEWFKKNFAFPCRGIESNIFNQIPKIYKEFRKTQIESGSPAFNQSLLRTIQKKDEGRQIHREELELIVGFINTMIYGVYRKSRIRFEAMKNNKYVKAYKEWVKPVIGIDEATDYSYVDYYFVTSFRHYEFSSVTLCGDLMQGLNSNGVREWDDLRKSVLPGLEEYELKESYRQVPTLLDMSKRLYRDDRGVEAPYSTSKVRSESEPAPICYVSGDMEDKAAWMCRRIIEIYKYYGETMPAVAILVGDEVNIPELKGTMEDTDMLNGIEIYDCSENRTTNSTKCVRIFRVSEIKGMEFEVVFFYDIDESLSGCTHEMTRRYLYVGVSRATSHLAATFTKKEGNEDLIKYFDVTRTNWKIGAHSKS